MTLLSVGGLCLMKFCPLAYWNGSRWVAAPKEKVTGKGSPAHQGMDVTKKQAGEKEKRELQTGRDCSGILRRRYSGKPAREAARPKKLSGRFHE